MRNAECPSPTSFLHRNAVSTADSSNPSNRATAIDTRSATKVNIDVLLSDGASSWNITPLYWNEDAGCFFAGVTFAANQQYVHKTIDCYGTDWMYMLLTDPNGDATASVYVQPIISNVNVA